jgi:hypothetical protein
MEGLMIAIICTDGQMKIDEIENECINGKWVPLLVLKEKNTNQTFLPVFNLKDVAYKFIIRNLPRKWHHGCVFLSDDDICTIIQKDWKFMPLDFPRKLNEHPDYEISFEIHEFKEEPEFKVG